MASPCTVTRLHHYWGANEAEISFQMSALATGFEPRTSQSNGRERYHSTTAHTVHDSAEHIDSQLNFIINKRYVHHVHIMCSLVQSTFI